MKQFSMQILPTYNRKTVSDLKIKKSVQLTSQDLTRIHNTFKFRQHKLSPIIGEITVIPLNQKSETLREMLKGNQITRLKTPIKKLHSLEIYEKFVVRTEPKQKQENENEINQIKQEENSVKNQIRTQSKLQKQLTSLQTKVANSRKLYYKMKTLPKIQNSIKNQTSRMMRPMLTAIDQNLKSIKALHYFILQYETQNPVISYRSKTKIQVASLTKIMTFYTIFKICQQLGLNFKQVQIEIEEEMVCIPGTTASLQQNRIYTLQQLLYGLMLPSGNDASIALAIWGGRMLASKAQAKNQIKIFVERMNLQAKELKMADTSYGNPHGLPHKDNKTTCEDVAKLCCACLNIPIFCQIVSTQIYKFKYINKNSKRKVETCWQNTNKLLRRPGFIGIKTGITVTAGPCLASAYQFLGKTYIVVIAKCSKPSRRFKETRKLLVHCLSRVNHGRPLTKEEQLLLKKLGRTNQEIDSDYSDEEIQFDFGTFSCKEIQKRTRILTQL